MSAIAGIRRADGLVVQAAVLYHMLQTMVHRAPDGTSVWHEGPVALGHGLLRTLCDTDGDTQPLVDGALVITADVRLDNRDELLEVLQLHKGTDDAALILGAYRRWGYGCPERLLGDFAFGLWDSRSATLFCARDRAGVKPFYYHANAERVIFASEIKALLAIPNLPREIEEPRVADFLAGIVSDHSSTLYTDIFRLPAGHYLIATPVYLRVQPYWRMQASVRELRPDSAEQFRDLFSTAVRSRMRGKLPTGVMLSGGLDSSSVSCVAARILRDEKAQPLSSFSLVFDKTPSRSERSFIEAVLAQYEFNSVYLASDSFPIFADFDQFLTMQDGVFLAPGLTMNGQLYRAAANRGVRVLLDGHGGDEVVSHGFGRLKELACAGHLLELWRQVHGQAGIYHTPAWRTLASYMSHHGPSSRVLRPLRRVQQSAMRRFRSSAGSNSRPGALRFMNPDFIARTGVKARCRAAMDAMTSFRVESEQHLNAVAAPLQPYALEVLDKSAAAAGVEARYPFWDKRLVEFCLTLPADAKLDKGWSRMILRRAMEGILPDQIRWRKDKFNFGQHIVRGMLAHHRPLLDHVLLEDAEDVSGYVDISAVSAAYQRVLKQAEQADGYDVQAIWKTVALAKWLRQRRETPSDSLRMIEGI
jgi:asparagine synthase (glutamine-hydrolysing)